MADHQIPANLGKVISTVRDRISKFRSIKSLNEQNTKASLIVPILEALGWDTNDADEVHWEYRRKPKSDPVDFALLLQRAPCLFLEAKALSDDLRDDKAVKQILAYASEAGVQWVALTNGDEYRIYNSVAPVPAEEKLFRTITVSKDSDNTILGTLSLLSKPNLQDKRIGIFWESHFVDRQVESAIEKLFSPDEPTNLLIRAVRKLTGGKLRASEIRASIRRARIHLDFPEEPEIPQPKVAVARQSVKKEPRKKRTSPSDESAAVATVSLQAIVATGILPTPAKLFHEYNGQYLQAIVESDGSVLLDGVQYTSPSMAAAIAKKPFHKGDQKGGAYPNTNGWVFWHLKDPESQQTITLDVLRNRFLQNKGTGEREDRKTNAETTRFRPRLIS